MDYSTLFSLDETTKIPDWLVEGVEIRHSQQGCGIVASVFGSNCIVNFGGKTQVVPVSDITLAKEMAKVEDFELISSTFPNFSDIQERSHRQIAKELSDAILQVEVQAAVNGDLFDLPTDLDPRLSDALSRIGIKQLFSHQIQGLVALRQGNDIAPMTPTASGKTLTFNVGIFEGLIKNSENTALYLFPLKALATDQAGKLTEIADALPVNVRPRIGVITGDVKDYERQRMFKPTFPQILAMSPDVLHHQIYKIRKDEWEQWRLFLRGLKYVVVDEAHTYVSTFGGHFANLMSRLRLAVDTCGGDSNALQFVFATATVGNASEMISKFSGRSSERVEIIDKSGAGSRGRTTLCLKPSHQPSRDAAEIVQLWLKYGLSGIVFVNSRAQAKSLYAALRKDLGSKSGQIATYYGGLSERSRADVVSGLRSGRVKVVISTSALEAGLDLPAIDACLCVGFAGSLMSHRQRIGRAGRKNPGLVMFLPYHDRPLDWFFGNNPKELLQGQVESAQFNPEYPTILAGHLKCAATESGIPLDRLEQYFGTASKKVVDKLLSSRELQVWGEKLSSNGYPHRDVSIRGSKADSIELIDRDNPDEPIEEMDIATAHKEVHEGAIYEAFIDGAVIRYECLELDLNGRKALLKRIYDDHFSTYALTNTTIKQTVKMNQDVIATTVNEGRLRLTLGWGKISRVVYGYQLRAKSLVNICRTRNCQNFNVEFEFTQCPVCRRNALQVEKKKVVDEIKFEQALFTSHEAPVLKLEINPTIKNSVESEVESLKQAISGEYPDLDYPREVEDLWQFKPEFLALHSICHQMQIAMPMLVLSSQYDIDSLVVEGDKDADPRLVTTIAYLFDTVHGGSGATEEAFKQFRSFAHKAKALSDACACSHGCPKCLLVSSCGQFNAGLNKQIGVYTLGTLNLESLISEDGGNGED